MVSGAHLKLCEYFRRPPYAEPYPYHAPGSSYGPPVPPLPSVDCEIIVLDEKQRLADIQIQLLELRFILI